MQLGKTANIFLVERSVKKMAENKMVENVDMEVQGMNKRVVIDTHENYVIARCGDKEGIARCHLDDNFDFYTGAKIALERLEKADKPYSWLESGTRYYTPDITARSLYIEHAYATDIWDKRYMERGIVFQTPEEAIACAKKMLEVVKQEG
jgi:hypothetical protein